MIDFQVFFPPNFLESSPMTGRRYNNRGPEVWEESGLKPVKSMPTFPGPLPDSGLPHVPICLLMYS